MSAEPIVVEFQIRLAASPDHVFRYLTEEDRYVRWQGRRVRLDPRPGGEFRVWMDETQVASGTFVEVVRPNRVVYTWGWEGDPRVPPGSTTVEFTLEADGDGTLLSLRHSGLPDGASAALHRDGWTFFTSRLSLLAAGGDPGPMPDAPP